MNKQFTWNFRGRKSIRLKEYDYSLKGGYFITICTHQKQLLFGKVVDGKMYLNRLGYIVHHQWRRVGRLRKKVGIDAFIVMPNHIHMMFWLKKTHARCRDEAEPRPYTKREIYSGRCKHQIRRFNHRRIQVCRNKINSHTHKGSFEHRMARTVLGSNRF